MALSAAAGEIKVLEVEHAEKLRASAASLRAEAIRTMLAGMTARAAAERISVITQIADAGDEPLPSERGPEKVGPSSILAQRGTRT